MFRGSAEQGLDPTRVRPAAIAPPGRFSLWHASPAGPSFETLHRYHLSQYRRWVLVGLVASLFGYSASVVSFTVNDSWHAALVAGDPFVVLALLVSLAALLRGYPRLAAGLALGATFIDTHGSLFLLRMPTLATVGLVMPCFVLSTGLLFGGRIALWAAGVLLVSIPTTVWSASLVGNNPGLSDPAVRHFVVVVEAVVISVTALLMAFLYTFAEILEQHQAGEEQRRGLQAELQHAQKLEALGLLAGGVAHDFNNLLAAIGGYGSLLERSSDPKARDLGMQIVSAQQRGATLTRQLLAFARKDIPKPRPIDLARTLAGLTELLKRAVGPHTHLHIEAEPGCTIVADPGRIEQVAFNLAVNARDAMPEGGHAWIRCTKLEDLVTFEVEDEGVGMDDATRLRIFEPFFSTKGRNGTGLGLSTVHGIVAESGGSIHAISRVGEGARFVIRWPRTALVPEVDSERPVELRGDGRTVLLVEDNDGARVYVERLLTDCSFRVLVARSTEEALSITAGATSPPALVLSDVILPGLTGPDLVARLRARWPSVPCLFVSGYVGDIALGPGFDPTHDLVPKPFTSNELLAHVARKLGDPVTSSAPVVAAGETAVI
jgi:signal transduction histidine kinase/ActR/RegA family two-component response regulator